ncbi:hypothetical protein ScPMuIL_006862 [Solemya velum]
MGSIVTSSGDSTELRSGVKQGHGQNMNTRLVPPIWDVLGGFGATNVLPYRPTGVMTGHREAGFSGKSRLPFTSHGAIWRHMESDNDWYDGMSDNWDSRPQLDSDNDWSIYQPLGESERENDWESPTARDPVVTANKIGSGGGGGGQGRLGQVGLGGVEGSWAGSGGLGGALGAGGLGGHSGSGGGGHGSQGSSSGGGGGGQGGLGHGGLWGVEGSWAGSGGLGGALGAGGLGGHSGGGGSRHGGRGGNSGGVGGRLGHGGLWGGEGSWAGSVGLGGALGAGGLGGHSGGVGSSHGGQGGKYRRRALGQKAGSGFEGRAGSGGFRNFGEQDYGSLESGNFGGSGGAGSQGDFGGFSREVRFGGRVGRLSSDDEDGSGFWSQGAVRGLGGPGGSQSGFGGLAVVELSGEDTGEDSKDAGEDQEGTGGGLGERLGGLGGRWGGLGGHLGGLGGHWRGLGRQGSQGDAGSEHVGGGGDY